MPDAEPMARRARRLRIRRTCSPVRHLAFVLLLGTVMTASGCAALEQLRALVQAPKFEEADGQPAEIRILPPGSGGPLGGAGVRIWTKVTNPNSFGIRLGTLAGTLFLE